MRIALAIQKIARQGGGAERVLVDLANHLQDAGHMVSVVTYENSEDPPFYRLRTGIAHHNLKPISLRRRSRAYRRWRGSFPFSLAKGAGELADRIPVAARVRWNLQYAGFIRRWVQYLAWTDPDIVIAFMPGSFPYVERALRKASHRAKLVVSLHNLPDADFNDPLKWDPNRYDRWNRIRSLGRAAAVTVLLPAYKQWFPSEYQSRIHVVPNVMAPNPEKAVLARKKEIISVGRLTATKNHEALLRAFAEISREFPAWKIRIYGRGPLEESLRALILELKLEEQAFLMGQSAEVWRHLLESEILALPSLYEGFPLAVGEAFASGLPVIGYADCSGLRDLVENERTGVLVAPSDRVRNLAAGLRRLMDDPEGRRRMGAKGLEVIASARYSAERVWEAWDTVIATSEQFSKNLAQGKGNGGLARALGVGAPKENSELQSLSGDGSSPDPIGATHVKETVP